MGKTYAAVNLLESGDIGIYPSLEHLGGLGLKINPDYCRVSKTTDSTSDFRPLASKIESAEICCLDTEPGSSEAWFGFGYALALGRPFVAAIGEDEIPRLLSLHGKGRAAFPRRGAHSAAPQEDRICLTRTGDTDLEQRAEILRHLASRDRYRDYGHLKSQIRNHMRAPSTTLETLGTLLDEGLVQEQYDVLGGDEITETFAVTSEGLAWLKRFEEARDPANDYSESGGSSLLFFAD